MKKKKKEKPSNLVGHQKPSKSIRKCANCIHLYSKHGKVGPCWGSKSKNLNKRACKFYKAGFPFAPIFDKRIAKAIPIKKDEPQSFIFHTDTQAFVLAWTKDDLERWHWKIRLVGIKPGGGLHSKNFHGKKHSKELAAFFGEVEIVGIGLNTIFSSFAYEDVDERDDDGILVNKPREVRIYPAQERKGFKRHAK